VISARWQPRLPRGIEEVIASRLGRAAFQQKLGLDQLEDHHPDALGGIGVELEHRVTDGLRREEETDDLQQDQIRCKGSAGQVIDDPQLTFVPIRRLATCASQRERTFHGKSAALCQLTAGTESNAEHLRHVLETGLQSFLEFLALLQINLQFANL